MDTFKQDGLLLPVGNAGLPIRRLRQSVGLVIRPGRNPLAYQPQRQLDFTESGGATCPPEKYQSWMMAPQEAR